MFYLYVKPVGQKGAPDLITDGCEPLCGSWELNSEPLEEQLVLLTCEPSLQPCLWVFIIHATYGAVTSQMSQQ